MKITEKITRHGNLTLSCEYRVFPAQDFFEIITYGSIKNMFNAKQEKKEYLHRKEYCKGHNIFGKPVVKTLEVYNY